MCDWYGPTTGHEGNTSHGEVVAHIDHMGPTSRTLEGNELMRDRFLARFWRWAALMAVMAAIGVISIQTDQLSAQQPPDNNPATGTPTLIGQLQVGAVLRVDTSSIADPDGLTNPSFSYTWLADDDLLEPGAFLRALSSVNEYEVAPYDAGMTIKVQVHFEDDNGNSESLDVEATSTVAAVVPDAPPSLSASLR